MIAPLRTLGHLEFAPPRQWPGWIITDWFKKRQSEKIERRKRNRNRLVEKGKGSVQFTQGFFHGLDEFT